MKKLYAFTVLVLFAGSTSFAQCSFTTAIAVSGATTGCGTRTLAAGTSGDIWTQKANYIGFRQQAVAFSIGNKGYFGTGYISLNSYSNSFWEYDPATNAWTQRANFAGTARFGAVGFSIGNKGYIGTGGDVASTYTSDFWEYDPAANLWTQRANFGGAARFMATGFSLNNKGYIGTGYNASGNLQDFWEYDPATNLWVQKTNFGGTPRSLATGFSIGGKGYLGTGQTATNTVSDFWEYDPTLDTWIQKANVGYTVYGAASFVINGRGYLTMGYNQASSTYPNQLYQFDPGANTWTQGTGMGLANRRAFAAAFAIGQKAYVGTGTGPGGILLSFLEYEGNSTYLWSTGATTQSINVSTAGTYSVLLTSANGCTASAAQIMSVSPDPTITVSGGTVNCAGTSNTLIATGAASYTWSANLGAVNTASVLVSPTVTTTYTVSGTTGSCSVSYPVTLLASSLPTVAVSSGTMCSGQDFTLMPTGAVSYTYLPGGSAVVSPNTNTSYSVGGSNAYGCVSASAAVATLTVFISPTISINGGSICAGQQFTLNPSGASTYTYSSNSAIVSPNTNTSYSISGTAANGCVSNSPAIASLTVYALPAISAANGTICSGQSFTINSIGANSYTYSGGSPIVSPTISATFTVDGTSMQGCNGNTTVSVFVQPALTVSINGPTSVCQGQNVSLTGSGASSYTWSTGSNSSSITISPIAVTLYSLTGTNGVCSGSATQSVSVIPVPTLQTIASHSILCAGETGSIMASGADQYTWSNGSAFAVIVITPTVNSSYTLTGINLSGCKSTAIVTQSVTECLGINNKNTPQIYNIKVYPNPNSGLLTIHTNELPAHATIELYNYLGQLIISQKISGESTQLQFDNAANGIYTLHVSVNATPVFVTKIIKQ